MDAALLDMRGTWRNKVAKRPSRSVSEVRWRLTSGQPFKQVFKWANMNPPKVKWLNPFTGKNRSQRRWLHEAFIAMS